MDFKMTTWSQTYRSQVFSDDGARIIRRWSRQFGCLGLRQDDGLVLRARGSGFCGKAGSGLRRSAFLFSGVAS